MEHLVTVQKFTFTEEDVGEVRLEGGVEEVEEVSEIEGEQVVGKPIGVRTASSAGNQITGVGNVQRRTACVRGAGVWGSMFS